MDINTLTLGEVAKIEELSGQSVAALAKDDAPKGLSMAAMAYVTKRRTDLTFKWEDALALTMPEVYEILGMSDEDPTSAL